MSARDDYPALHMATASPAPLLSNDARMALDEIDRLRAARELCPECRTLDDFYAHSPEREWQTDDDADSYDEPEREQQPSPHLPYP